MEEAGGDAKEAVETSPKADVNNEDEVEEEKEGEYREVADDGWEDVLGSGRLRKRILKSAAAFFSSSSTGRPGQSDTVRLNVKGFFQDEQFLEEDDYEFFASEGEVVPALDMIVCLMDVGEVSEVMADPEFAYGDAGLPPTVPPKAAVRFEVELLSSEPAVPVADVQPVEERRRIGRRKRERGNFWFGRKNYALAVQCYRKAGEFFDDDRIDLDVPVDRYLLPQELQELVDDRLKAFNNLAMAQIQLEAWDAALAALVQVLKIEPNNEKALYRKSRILAETCRLDEAVGILRRLTRLYPDNASSKVDLARLVVRQKKSRLNEERMSKKMLGLDKYEAEQKASRDARWKIWATSLAVGIAGVVIGGVAYFGSA